MSVLDRAELMRADDAERTTPRGVNSGLCFLKCRPCLYPFRKSESNPNRRVGS
jgi:hypothetical protein